MPWTPTPSGYLSRTLEGLAEMVANSEAFQTACGLTAPDAAAQAKLIFGTGGTKRIYLCAFENAADFRDGLPKLFITAMKATSIAQAGGETLQLVPESREFVITLVADAEDDDLEVSYLTHLNLVGDMEREINLQSGSDDLPAINRITLENVGSLSPFEEKSSKGADYWLTQWLVSVAV